MTRRTMSGVTNVKAGVRRCPVLAFALVGLTCPPAAAGPASLPRVKIAADGRSFTSGEGKPFVPFGVTYYRPGTGWAPQVWKQFDAEAVRRDFARLRAAGANCVRVFLSFGSFYERPGELSPAGLAKFDRFLELAEEAGLYVHPTGPDHWEGLPEWANGDRVADDAVLDALEVFWKRFAGRYRGRTTLFAYDLRNEPEVGWDSPLLRAKWNAWVTERYGSAEKAAAAWGAPADAPAGGQVPVPAAEDRPRDPRLLDYQRFRESIAETWTRRQAAAIRAADPEALVTVGLIQWSVPVLLPGGPQHYSAFRPDRLAPCLDFLEIHFYPLAAGLYQYRTPEERDRNLAYLESVVRETARPGKPVVVAEFGWYGGGSLPQGGGRTREATEEDQADWCGSVVETTAGLATGWLNWGLYDHPQANDVSRLTGLFTVEGREKAWGRRFRDLAERFRAGTIGPARIGPRPEVDWDLLVTSPRAAAAFREEYFKAFGSARRPPK